MASANPLVCIVDDDDSVRRAFGRMVKSMGCDTVLLSSGRECLDSSCVDHAACLIIDVSMPDIDGFELDTLLKANGCSVPTVFMSAYSEESYRDKARLAGAVGFLSKPCDEPQLQEVIDAVLAP